MSERRRVSGRALIGVITLVAACGPVGNAAPVATIDPAPASAAPDPRFEVVERAGIASPDPIPSPAAWIAPPNVKAPDVKAVASTFPIGAPTGALVRATSSADREARARFGVQSYLAMLDRFRKGEVKAIVTPAPPFAGVLTEALRGTMRPGVVRQFELVSIRIDAAYQKPWGRDTLLDVTVTIRDKVLSGSAAEDSETGRLRLAGESRFVVIDGWDGAHQRWYNGLVAPTRSIIQESATLSLQNYLWTESWLPGSPTVTFSNATGATSPFAKARDAWLASFDRAKVTGRILEDVSAQVERYDPTTELGDGIATVRLSGVVVTTDGASSVQRTPFERRVRVFLKWWGFQGEGAVVVDDEASPGVWRSGGDLVLKEIDRQSVG